MDNLIILSQINERLEGNKGQSADTNCNMGESLKDYVKGKKPVTKDHG